MRVGLMAYSTDTGLGRQTHEFFANMKPHKTLVVDISHLNGVQTHHERFPGARITKGLPDLNDLEWLADDVDAVFVCETPLDFRLFEITQRRNVASILQFNPEFLDYFSNPNLPAPTVLAAPTWWMVEETKQLNIAPVLDWKVPVNEQAFEHQKIGHTGTFGHIVGRPAIHDRNGTHAFLSAAHLLNQRLPDHNLKFEIFIQSLGEHYAPLMEHITKYQDLMNLSVMHDVPNPKRLFTTIDVLVMPRRFGGLCLPMQEALSAGVPVIMPNIIPNMQFLPPLWLVPAFKTGEFQTRTTIELYDTDIEALVDTMESFATSDAFTRWSNGHTKRMREQLSWKNMRNRYNDLIEQTCLTSQS